VHEQHDAIVARCAALDRRGLDALAHVQLHGLPLERGNDRAVRHVVIDRENLLTVFARRRLRTAGPAVDRSAE
jgi:hypothetical protein